MQGSPAGLPCGMPGIELLIEGAMQQAAQPRRQAIGASLRIWSSMASCNDPESLA
jgi:hypothetical protein